MYTRTGSLEFELIVVKNVILISISVLYAQSLRILLRHTRS